MAPEIPNQMDPLTYLRMGEGEGFTPQAQNLRCYFRQQAYIKQTHGGEEVCGERTSQMGDDSYRHLGEALATNPDQLS
jgi:hypothetical protein